MKTSDNFFRGFPGLWNAAAFHLFVLKLPPWAAACVVAVLVILTFMPLRVLHPFRVAQFRSLNLVALAAWSILGIYAVIANLDPGAIVAWCLAVLASIFLRSVWQPPTTERKSACCNYLTDPSAWAAL